MGVGDLEIEPLRVTLSVDVILHQTIILLVADLGGEVQIAALESRLKQQSFVVRSLLYVIDVSGILSLELWRVLRLLPLRSAQSFIQLLIHSRADFIFCYELLDVEEVLVLEHVSLGELRDGFVQCL